MTVVMGATMTVRRCWFISSGGTTKQRRVFWISRPSAGSDLYPPARGVRPDDRGHGSNDDGPQMLVHLIGRDDQTRARFLDLHPLGGIQRHQPDLILFWRALWRTLWRDHHRHSSRSNSFGPVASSMSSSAAVWPDARKASPQPWRGRRSGEMIKQSRSTRISTA